MSNLFFDIFTSGIDFSLPGNGGPECLAHTSYTERAVESVLSVLTFSTAIIAGLKVSERLGSKDIHGLILHENPSLVISNKTTTKNISGTCKTLCYIQCRKMEIQYSSCLAVIFNAHYMDSRSCIQGCNQAIHFCCK